MKLSALVFASTLASALILAPVMGGSACASTHSHAISANAYDLNMDLSLNGKHLSSPHVIVKEGHTATITQKTAEGENFIEVIPTQGKGQNSQGILMKFTVGMFGKNGERTVISRPHVFALENSPATITIDQNGQSDALSLSVTAKRKMI